MKQMPNRYGPRKIGEEEFQRQQAMKQFEGRQATVYGKRKGDGNAKPVLLKHTDPDTQRDKPREAAETGNPFRDEKGEVVTIGAMKEVLEADPSLLDVAIETELAQSEPRKGAIEFLMKTERARPAGERESVIQLLEKLA